MGISAALCITDRQKGLLIYRPTGNKSAILYNVPMRILLTNDDGVYAPGLAAMERALRRLGEVFVLAPLHEQSGVAHAMTFLTPLQVRKVYVNDKPWAWTVDGTPADCVKLAISEVMSEPPDLVVSGINGGLNAGVNVFYSGTLAAAIEGSFYGSTSIAVSLQYDESERYHQAADLAVGVIEKILKQNSTSGRLYNVNIPQKALRNESPEVKVVPVDRSQHWETFERRIDPVGRNYYWLTWHPEPRSPDDTQMTDLTALAQGYITVTPLDCDPTDKQGVQEMADWDLNPKPSGAAHDAEQTGPQVRVSWRV